VIGNTVSKLESHRDQLGVWVGQGGAGAAVHAALVACAATRSRGGVAGCGWQGPVNSTARNASATASNQLG
jgi:hypothetical protein